MVSKKLLDHILRFLLNTECARNNVLKPFNWHSVLIKQERNEISSKSAVSGHCCERGGKSILSRQTVVSGLSGWVAEWSGRHLPPTCSLISCKSGKYLNQCWMERWFETLAWMYISLINWNNLPQSANLGVMHRYLKQLRGKVAWTPLISQSQPGTWTRATYLLSVLTCLYR